MNIRVFALAATVIASTFLAPSMGAQADQTPMRHFGVAETLASTLVDSSDYTAYRRRGASRGRRNAAGAAVAVGVAGALIGGAIASQNRRRYRDDYYYDRSYGRPAYGYGPGYYRY